MSTEANPAAWKSAHTNPPARSGTYEVRDVRWPDQVCASEYDHAKKQWSTAGRPIVLGMPSREGLDEWRELPVAEVSDDG